VDQIYNGADDNASGTAALLEIAGAVGSMSTPPKRSIVFLAASAEELGLRGSMYYMSHSPFPPEATVANLNLDMIGRGETNHVWLIHEVSSEIAPIALAVAAQHPDLGLTPEDSPDEVFIRRSDSGAFVLYGVDALFFHSGLHSEYHQVSDEVMLLNTLKIEKVARLAYWVAVELAGRP
jgi:Zn-dependent M28 family amino/carboxypeptidase